MTSFDVDALPDAEVFVRRLRIDLRRIERIRESSGTIQSDVG